MAVEKRERERTGQHAHRWRDDACTVCGLRRRETWVLSKKDEVVMALVWVAPGGGIVRALEFAYFTGMRAPRAPTQTLAEAFPGVRVGREPKCPGDTASWTSSDATSDAAHG